MTAKKQNIEETFNQEQNRLQNYIRSKVATTEDAEDILQDVFMSLVGGFDDISELRNSISWLYSVARNKIVDYRRKSKTYSIEDQKVKTDEDESLNLIDLIPSIDSLADDQMMMDMVWEEIQIRLEELPKEQREVFELHELEAYSFQQISDSTGITINTLISRKRYAVLYLRKNLEELFAEIKNS